MTTALNTTALNTTALNTPAAPIPDMTTAGLGAHPLASIPPARPSSAWREWTDRFVGSDPGLNRFLNALQSVLSIACILGTEWIFVHFTHALQTQTHGAVLPAAQAAEVATANHEFLVIAMLLGAIVGMISSFGVMDATARGQLGSMLLLPVPMVAALALGISIGGHRVIALGSLAVVLAVGTYLRRFGPRGFLAGMLLFMGDFFGFFLHGAVTMSDLGWLTAEIGVGLVTAMAVRFGLFYPRHGRALRRTQRSYAARARKVARLTLDLFDTPAAGEGQRRALRRQLVRLNEAALMIDAQLVNPGALADGSSGQLLHQRLYDTELALTNIARFTEAMSQMDLPPAQWAKVRLALVGICDGDLGSARAAAEDLLGQLRLAGSTLGGEDRTTEVIPHRFAGSVAGFVDAMDEWLTVGDRAQASASTVFQPSVALFGGWLPGSAMVSAMASTEASPRRREQITMAPWTRMAIQMGIAVGAAIALGDVLSGRRFYWAVIAAFITFMGANNSGEQTRKAIFRVMGTVVGITVGSVVVHLVGHHTNWSIAVILVALFFGFYLMRINYAFMVIGITVMVSQLYVQLDEFSNSLLLLRLEETALGAAVAIITVALVFPLRTKRVLRVALRAEVTALADLVDHATDQLAGRGERHEDLAAVLRSDARKVDAAHQATIATVQPLRRNLFGDVDELVGRAMRMAEGSRNYGRNLVADVSAAQVLDEETGREIGLAGDTLRTSLDVVIAAYNGPRDTTYTRSSALFDRAERRLEERSRTVDPAQLAIRDLKLIDATMARMAELLGLQVADFDTSRVQAMGSPA
jgi:hypothetical protein